MSDKGTLNRSNNKRKVEILRFFIKFLQKVLVIREKVVPLHPQFRTRRSVVSTLGYGVMVTLQILVLSFLVRVRVPQLKKEKASKWKPFLFLLFLILSVDSLDLLTYEVHVVFQLLNLAVHLVNEAVALL